MPTDTFFRLPQEKRTKLLDAALEAFSRVPFAQVSINKIIQGAGIPRGSFYMYFADKEDLFRHLLGTYRQRLCQLACQALDDCGGDLFAAFVQIYGHMEQAAAEKRSCAEDSTRLLAMFRLNAPLSPNLLFQAIQPEELLTQLIPHMDLRLLSLTADSDLSDVLHILTGITVSSLAAGAASDAGPEPARQHYLHTVQLLKRGMAAPQPISH